MKKIKIGAIALATAGVFALASCSTETSKSSTSEVKTSTAAVTTSTTEAKTSTTAEFHSVDSEGTLSYSEFVKTEDGNTVTFDAYIQGKTTWYNNAASFYLADDNGAYYVYNLPCTEEDFKTKLVEGANIKVTGYKTSWKGQVEVMGNQAGEEGTYEVLSGTHIYDAKKVDTLAALVNYPNQLIALDNLTVTEDAKYGWDGSGKASAGQDIYFSVTDGTTTYSFVLEAYLTTTQFGSDIYTTVSNLKKDDKISLEGFAYTYNDPQVQVTKVVKK